MCAVAALVRGGVSVGARRGRTQPGAWRALSVAGGGDDVSLRVLYEDRHVVAVLKPACVPSQPDPTGDVDLLRMACETTGQDKLHLCHRLDRPVSGVMLLAKHRQAAAMLGEQFRLRQVDKRYIAVVQGACEGEGEMRHVITWRGRGRRANVVPFDPALADKEDDDGQYSSLRWQALAHFENARHGTQTLLRINLGTGRKHQIRAQLASAGHPIVGDIKYGAPARLKSRMIALHAYSLQWRPFLQRGATNDAEELRVRAPPPREAWEPLFSDEFYDAVASACRRKKRRKHETSP